MRENVQQTEQSTTKSQNKKKVLSVSQANQKIPTRVIKEVRHPDNV